MRYFLNLVDRDGHYPDPEGVELCSLPEAKERALVGARSIICEDIRSGILDLASCMTVVDARGDTVFHLPFGDAVGAPAGAEAA